MFGISICSSDIQLQCSIRIYKHINFVHKRTITRGIVKAYMGSTTLKTQKYCNKTYTFGLTHYIGLLKKLMSMLNSSNCQL